MRSLSYLRHHLARVEAQTSPPAPRWPQHVQTIAMVVAAAAATFAAGMSWMSVMTTTELAQTMARPKLDLGNVEAMEAGGGRWQLQFPATVRGEEQVTIDSLDVWEGSIEDSIRVPDSNTTWPDNPHPVVSPGPGTVVRLLVEKETAMGTFTFVGGGWVRVYCRLWGEPRKLFFRTGPR